MRQPWWKWMELFAVPLLLNLGCWGPVPEIPQPLGLCLYETTASVFGWALSGAGQQPAFSNQGVRVGTGWGEWGTYGTKSKEALAFGTNPILAGLSHSSEPIQVPASPPGWVLASGLIATGFLLLREGHFPSPDQRTSSQHMGPPSPIAPGTSLPSVIQQ